MFHKTSTKLAGLYLAILMAISIFFSLAVYQLSTEEFDRDFRQQNVIVHAPSLGVAQGIRDELLEGQQARYDEARLRVIRRLLLINLFILVGGGFLSYYLSRWTLQPIEESHAALERFTADASHELRTPLSAIRTETEVALMNPKLTLTEAKKKLRSNIEEVQKLTVLSDELLRLARLEKTTKRDTLAAKTLVNRAVEQIRPLAEARQLTIQTKLPTGLRIEGDEHSLVEALVIILDNAVKYSSEKSAVHVAAHANGDQVEISVSDEGIGIKPADLKRIFERFYRADSARSKQGTNGYGLGLAIAKDIIDLHGGKIDISSEPGQGSTFTIRLPLSGPDNQQVK